MTRRVATLEVWAHPDVHRRYATARADGRRWVEARIGIESAQRGPIVGRAAIRGDAFEVFVGAGRIVQGDDDRLDFRSMKASPAPKPRSEKVEGSGTTIPSRNQRSVIAVEGVPLINNSPLK